MSVDTTIAEKVVPGITPVMTSRHVGVAAEAVAAAQFARCGYDISVQYGANQPQYDLIVARGDAMMKVSVKGSKDGGWVLTPNMKGATYHEAADAWALRHNARTVLCFVQFEDVQLDQLPRVYLATVAEVAAHLKRQAGGRGDSTLYERHAWGPRAAGAGTIDEVPAAWKLTVERVSELIQRL